MFKKELLTISGSFLYKKEGITCILIPIRIITSKQLTTFMEHTLFLVTSILPGYITGATGMQIMRLLSRHKRPFPLKNSFNLPN